MRQAVRVSTAEAELLAVARALVSPEAHASIEGTLGDRLTGQVTKIGPTAMKVLESTLANGTVKMLARLGGARPRVRANTSQTRPTRVFEVRPPPAIAFGPYSYELIRWLTATPLHVREKAKFDATPETLGDELCAYFALRLVSGGRYERGVASAPGLRTPLTWLGFSRALARWGPETEPSGLAGILATEDQRIVVECLAGDLAQRAAAATAWDPFDVLDPEHAVRIGTVERAVLGGFLDAVQEHDRWDLATFLVEAGARALGRGLPAKELAARATPRVRAEGTLRARVESRRRAGALFHALARLGKKRDALALVRFIDDDYDAAQAILKGWEVLGRDDFARAESVVSALDALEEVPQVGTGAGA